MNPATTRFFQRLQHVCVNCIDARPDIETDIEAFFDNLITNFEHPFFVDRKGVIIDQELVDAHLQAFHHFQNDIVRGSGPECGTQMGSVAKAARKRAATTCKHRCDGCSFGQKGTVLVDRRQMAGGKRQRVKVLKRFRRFRLDDSIAIPPYKARDPAQRPGITQPIHKFLKNILPFAQDQVIHIFKPNRFLWEKMGVGAA